MGAYKNVNEVIKQIMDFMKDQEGLIRLLFYNKDPLDPSNPVPKYSDLVLNNIYPYVNTVEPEDEAKSFVSIYLWNGNNSGSTRYKDTEIHIDVISHTSLWLMDSGDIRPYLIMNEIDSRLPFHKVESIRGNVVSLGSSFTTYNKRFMGYKLRYDITNGSLECKDD